MKKYIFLSLLIIVLGGCSNQRPNQELSFDSSENNLLVANLQLTVQADKTIYTSYEEINLSVEVLSDQNLNDFFIEAKGITSRLNRNYFDQSQNILLQKDFIKKISLSQALPACNSCSGLSPGNYQIIVTAGHQGQILATKKINLTIKQ